MGRERLHADARRADPGRRRARRPGRAAGGSSSIGIAIFAVASLVCAVATNAGILIAARAVQGIGAALLVPQSLAIIAASFPREVRGRAIGVWAAASAITTSLGPPLGGFLIDTLSWRVAFLINLPLSAVALWLTFTHVPESRDEHASGPLDWPGSALRPSRSARSPMA